MTTAVRFEAAFIEDGVFLAIRSYEKRGDFLLVQSFNAQKDLLYEKVADETAFREFYESFFLQLGLNTIFENIISEYPLLTRQDARISVKRVFSRKHEGGELYVDGNLKTVVLNVQPDRLIEPEALQKFLRHELLRVTDMLDPVF